MLFPGLHAFGEENEGRVQVERHPGGLPGMMAVVIRVRALGTAAAVVAVVAVGCSRGPDFDAARVVLDGASGRVAVRAALARTEPERERGLMGVRRLPADAGMAFLFDRPTRRGFWMKDTLVPLAAAFWDRTGRIVAILEMAPCRHDPCPVYSPHRAYVGALEVGRGFYGARGIGVGASVTVEPRP